MVEPPAAGLNAGRAVRKLAELPPFSPNSESSAGGRSRAKTSPSRSWGDLIEKDTLVAGNLLHLVNSALYARRGTINSVRHAISILGVNNLRNAVLGMSVSRMWNQVRTPPSWSMARFNMHSASSAILCEPSGPAITRDLSGGRLRFGPVPRHRATADRAGAGRRTLEGGGNAQAGRAFSRWNAKGACWALRIPSFRPKPWISGNCPR